MNKKEKKKLKKLLFQFTEDTVTDQSLNVNSGRYKAMAKTSKLLLNKF